MSNGISLQRFLFLEFPPPCSKFTLMDPLVPFLRILHSLMKLGWESNLISNFKHD